MKHVLLDVLMFWQWLAYKGLAEPNTPAPPSLTVITSVSVLRNLLLVIQFSITLNGIRFVKDFTPNDFEAHKKALLS